ncbi:uncharacterized protein LOC133036774 [Cannabis sativa]|uniref:uncharacterized protein LOC133036774 n=1 Tax=Cannabis sativa TaxID=3483 RepID=UPI0029CA47FB|nr:uncharacterized protein LOC133036774 [Cannabis sativa]
MPYQLPRLYTKRKVIDSALCSRCKYAWESIGHALFSCKSAKAVWKSTKFLIDYHHAQGMFNGDYLIHLASIMEKEDVEALICVMWSIWNDRNKPKTHQADPTGQIPHQQGFQDQYHTADQSHGMQTQTTVVPLRRFNSQQVGENQTDQARLNAHQHQQTASRMRHQPIISAANDNVQLQRPLDDIIWKPPAMNMLKLNVDAATNSKNLTLGMGAVVRNYKGDVIAALSKKVQGCLRSDEMEANALFHSLNWASQYQLLITIVETDALRVFSALKSNHNDLSCFNDLITNVRCLLSSFPRVIVTHARRQANKAAHGLVKYALELDEDVSWIGEIPYPIFSIIVNDC